MLANVLGGPGWSFTVHGPEEFDKARAIRTCRKDQARSNSWWPSAPLGEASSIDLVDQALWPKIHVVHCGLDADYLGPAVAHCTGPAPAGLRRAAVRAKGPTSAH